MFKTVNNKLMLTDFAYRFGKNLVQIYIPATSSAYFGLASIWGLPAAGQVSGTLAIVATFLGACLHISGKNYDTSGAAHDGDMVVTTGDDGKKTLSLNLNADPLELIDKDHVSFKKVDVPEDQGPGI